jgi:hypothetical protein
MKSDQGKPMELDDVLVGIIHRLDDGTSKLKAVYDRLLAIEDDIKGRASRGGSARYLLAICIGVAATLAWQSCGDPAKQIIATSAPKLAWSQEAKQIIAGWVERLGWTKPSAGPEIAAVRPSALGTQVATVGQTVPAKAPTTSIDPEQVHQIAMDLAALGRTVDQLAASQDQMVHQIDMLQTSNQEILASNQEVLAKIPAPPPPPTVASARKPTPVSPPSSRAPIPPPHP